MGSTSGRRLRLVLAALLALAGTARAAAAEDARGGEPIYPSAPEFAYRDVNPASDSFGQELALDSLRAERGVVLNFLASWCKYCWDELPELQRIDDAGRAPVVGVAADEYGPPDDLLARVARARLTIPVLLVPREEIDAMTEAWSHATLPATYVIDREGKIRAAFQGLAPLAALERAIERSVVTAATSPSP